MDRQQASSFIKQEAYKLGFDACGIAQIASADTEALFFDQWIAEGCHAGMKYMENYRELRLNPAGLIADGRSVICVALNYYPVQKQPAGAPRIAYYAYGKDYHVVVKEKLRLLQKQIMAFLTNAPERATQTCLPCGETFEARCFTDSAPILERYWAWKAGMGWIGKNTCLILPRKGSFFFLGELVTNLQLAYDMPVKNRCGSCTRCLEACPTGALEKPRKLNAAKCLSYLTIEQKEEIPYEQAQQLENRLYGCDTCQLVCPWNRFASPTLEPAFQASEQLLKLDNARLAALSKEEYNEIFRHSAVKRARYEGLKRTINQLK